MRELIKAVDGAVRTFCTFRAEGRLYGLDVSCVREVSTHVIFTPVPQAPPIVRGLTNLRSSILLVLDLRAALGLSATECTHDSRLLVLQPQVAENLGVLVEGGGEIVRAHPDQIELPDADTSGTAENSATERQTPVVGVCKLAEELLMIIDPARLVAATEKAIRSLV